MRKTFYQLASEKLESMGYKQHNSPATVGVFRKKNTVVLKNRTTEHLFRGYPERAAALMVVGEDVYPLYPEDFKQSTKVEEVS